MAYSGLACFPKTAWAAAQHRSSVSVSSIAASRIDVGIFRCNSILVSNGFFDSMGSPFAKLMCVGTISVVKRAAHHFNTRHPVAQCAGKLGVSLPDVFGPRRQACADWRIGVAGVFSLHDCSVIFLPLFVSPKHP
jgi:hypothetical protein